MKSVSRLIILAGILLASASLQAASPLGGLTVAVSSDGSKLVAGGDTRTLIVLDPATLEVQQRVWTGVSILNLAFNKEGSLLAVHETGDTVTLFNTADWTNIAEFPKMAAFTTNGELLAGDNGAYDGPTVIVRAFAEGGAEKMQAKFEKGVKIAALALSDDGAKLAVLTAGAKDESETKVAYGDIPKDLKGLDQDNFKQKNDGQTSKLIIYDTATGDQVSEATTFYSTSGLSKMFFNGDDVTVVNYTNLNATLTPEGEATLFELENSYNYGIGFSWDNSLILTGGLRDFSLTKTESLTGVQGSCDKLPSWPEYWQGFAATNDGALYGGTSAFRVFKLTPAGEVEKVQPAG